MLKQLLKRRSIKMISILIQRKKDYKIKTETNQITLSFMIGIHLKLHS